ncbi:MAG: FadR/GntR family transcriptional regulator, partial [Thermodesulfobacteriota bacterium]|nr:FadR/GntR family transcriptional regulator [Thermodesulfobacteriota bacterium]
MTSQKFRSVKSRRIPELIFQQIKKAIVLGTMKPGERLPPVRELEKRFQASRISIREALKNLEAIGLVKIKPGSGVFVAEVNLKPMSELFSSILRIQKASINELTEARIVFEPQIAKLTTERITPEDLLKLEQNINETLKINKPNLSIQARLKNIEFHFLIAESTHNPVIILTMKTLFDVLKEMYLETLDNSQMSIRHSQKAVEYHKKILKAFREKKSQKAYELMLM